MNEPALRRFVDRPVERLTPREDEVLRLLLCALSDKQISFQMGIQKPTVRFHVKNIFRKLCVGSRAELIVWCLQNRPVQTPPDAPTYGSA